MTEYTYTDKATSPDTSGIHADVAASAMSDKSLEYCNWAEEDATLRVFFANSIDAGDKTILDGIVSDNS